MLNLLAVSNQSIIFILSLIELLIRSYWVLNQVIYWALNQATYFPFQSARGSFVRLSLEVASRDINTNQVGPRSKMGCSFRFWSQKWIWRHIERKRANFQFRRFFFHFFFMEVFDGVNAPIYWRGYHNTLTLEKYRVSGFTSTRN